MEHSEDKKKNARHLKPISGGPPLKIESIFEGGLLKRHACVNQSLAQKPILTPHVYKEGDQTLAAVSLLPSPVSGHTVRRCDESVRRSAVTQSRLHQMLSHCSLRYSSILFLTIDHYSLRQRLTALGGRGLEVRTGLNPDPARRKRAGLSSPL